MTDVNLQELLAPTWVARARADDSLWQQLIFSPGGAVPPGILAQVPALQPSPQVFLEALLAFWRRVSEQQDRHIVNSARRKGESYPDTIWQAPWPHQALFPMQPRIPPVSSQLMCGFGVWNLIERLDLHLYALEAPLVALLDSPSWQVHHTAVLALGRLPSLSATGFAQLLSFMDRQGDNHRPNQSALALARHLDAGRLTALLQGLVPGVPEPQSAARLALVCACTDKSLLEVGQRHLIQELAGAWTPSQLANVIRTLAVLGTPLGFDPQAVALIQSHAHHSDENVRCATARFLAAHSPCIHQNTLQALIADDANPWVLAEIGHGWAMHSPLPVEPAELLSQLIAASLGNFDGDDGEPHDSAIWLLVKMGEDARIVTPQILQWWDGSVTEYELIQNAVDLAQALGQFAAPMRPGLECALEHLSEPKSAPDDEIPEDDLVVRLRQLLARLPV